MASRPSTARSATLRRRSPSRPVGRLRPVHGRAHPGRAHLRPSRATRTSSWTACPTPTTSRSSSAYRVLLPAARPRHRPRPRTTGSPPRARRCPDQLSAVLGRSVALETGTPRPALSPCSAPELRVVDTELVRLGGDDLGARRGQGAGARAPQAEQGGGAARAGRTAGAVQGAPVRNSLPGDGLPGGAQATRPGHGPRATARPGGRPVPGDRLAEPSPPGPLPAGPRRPPSSPCRSRTWTRATPTRASWPDFRPPPRPSWCPRPAAPTTPWKAAARAAGPAGPRRLNDRRPAALARLALGGPPADLAGGLVPAGRVAAPRDRRPRRSRRCPSTRSTTRSPASPRPSWPSACARRSSGQLDNAAEYYRLVWTTDPQLCEHRVRPGPRPAGGGRPPGSVRTLESVPEASIHYTAARVAAGARLRQRLAEPRAAHRAHRLWVRPVRRCPRRACPVREFPAGTAGAAVPDAPFLDDHSAAARLEALDGYVLDAARRGCPQGPWLRPGLGTLR